MFLVKRTVSRTEKSLLIASLLSAFLALAKFIIFLLTGSMIVLSSFFDSLSDTILSFFNSYFHKVSLEKADRQHPFGHGGIEVIASLMQGIVIVGLGVTLIFESAMQLSGQKPLMINTDWFPVAGLSLLVAALGSIGISIFLKKSLEQSQRLHERSLAMKADLAHYTADVYSNIAAALGLLIIGFLKMPWLDSLLGIIAGVLFLKTAYPVLKGIFKNIMHEEADTEIQQKIVDITYQAHPDIKGVHRLRTRELGPMLFIDFHLKLPRDLNLETAHNIGEIVIRKIKQNIPHADVIIHLDPDSEPDDDLWKPSYQWPQGTAK